MEDRASRDLRQKRLLLSSTGAVEEAEASGNPTRLGVVIRRDIMAVLADDFIRQTTTKLPRLRNYPACEISRLRNLSGRSKLSRLRNFDKDILSTPILARSWGRSGLMTLT